MKDKEMAGKLDDEKLGTLWTTAAVAREVGVFDATFRDWRKTGKITAAPSVKRGKRWFYTEEQVAELLREVKRRALRRAERDRHYTGIQLAKDLQVHPNSWRMHLRLGNLPKPALDDRYYTHEQAQAIRAFFSHRAKLAHDCGQLFPGLQQLGATRKEAEWCMGHKSLWLDLDQPFLGGRGKKSRYYSWQQLTKILRRCRLMRPTLNPRAQQRGGEMAKTKKGEK
jgi:DNA-binding transcriptional MerR regulator